MRYGANSLLVAAMATVALFAVSWTPTVSASHFRYGHMYWERDLSYSDSVYTKVKITIETGWRADYVEFVNPVVGQQLSVSVGSIMFESDVPGACDSVSCPPVTMRLTPTAIDTTSQIMFASTSFTYTYKKTAVPLRVTWTAGARILTSQDGNNDITWQLEMLIGSTEAGAGTKSPKSAALPVLSLTQGVLNTVTIPTVAFDNTVNRISIATYSQSLLTTAKPAGLELSGATSFTWTPPSATGVLSYAIQFRIEAYDANNVLVPYTGIPLDFLIETYPPCSGESCPSITVSAPPTVSASVNTPLSFAVTTALTNPTGLTTSIKFTPLPAGASFTAAPCAAGSASCSATFNWTPLVTSTSAVVCFQARAASGATAVVSNGQQCVSIQLAALATTTTALASSGVCGGPTTLSASVRRTADNTPVRFRPVEFVLPSDESTVLCIGLTSVTGVASCSFIPSSTAAVNFKARFPAIAFEFLASSSSVGLSVTRLATSTLTSPTVGLKNKDFPLSVSAKLVRQYTDGVSVPPFGTIVSHALSGPGLAVPLIVTAPTGFDGQSNATFASIPDTGAYTIDSTFGGDVCLFPLDTSDTPTVQQQSIVSTQRIALSHTLSTVTTYCNTPVSVTAALRKLPTGAALSGRSVAFSFAQLDSANTRPPVTVATDPSGAAQTSVQFPVLGRWMIGSNTPFVGGFESNKFGLPVNGGETESSAVDVVADVPIINLMNAAPVTPPGSDYPLTIQLTHGNGAPFAAGVFVSMKVTWENYGLIDDFSQVFPTGADGKVTFTPAIPTAGDGAPSVSLRLDYDGVMPCVKNTFVVHNLMIADPIPTALAFTPISDNNVLCHATTTVSATLTQLNGQSVTSGLLIQFFADAATEPFCQQATNTAGFVSCPFTPTAQSTVVTAKWAGNGLYSPSSSSARTYTIISTATSLSAPVAGSATASIGQTVTVHSTYKYNSDLSAVASAAVVFTVVGTSTSNAEYSFTAASTTDSNGIATATFVPPSRGQYKITASAAGTFCAAAVVASPDGFVSAYEAVTLTLSSTPAPPVCGADVTLVATLTPASGFPALPLHFDQEIKFQGEVSLHTGRTNDQGVVTYAVNSVTDTFHVTAVFESIDYYQAASAALDVTIVKASPSLSAVGVSTGPYRVGDYVTFTTALSTLPFSSDSIHFVVTRDPIGSMDVVNAVITGSTATGTFQFTARGQFTVHAVYTAPFDPCVIPAAPTATVPLTVEQRTAVSMVSTSGVCGAPITLSGAATLFASTTPVSGGSLTFTAGGRSCSGTTGVTGDASCAVTFPLPSVTPIDTVVDLAANPTLLLLSSTSAGTVSVSAAMTSISAFAVESVNLVGETITISMTLTRSSPPSGPLASADIVLAITGAESSTRTITTDAAGVATASFSIATRGVFHVRATYAGDGGCLAAATPKESDLQVYQRSYLFIEEGSTPGLNGVCGANTLVCAGLLAGPASNSDPIVGQSVSFSFTGGPAPISAVTDSHGKASVVVNWAAAGDYTATATFVGLSSYFVDGTGAPVSPVSTASVHIDAAETALDPLHVATTDFVGDDVTTVTILTRITHPNGPVPSATVSFTLTPTLSTYGEPVTVTGTSDAAGHVSVSLPLTSRGSFEIAASYAGGACLHPPSFVSDTITVFQKTQLDVEPVADGAAVCGAPIDLKAKLVAVPGASPIGGQTVLFEASSAVSGSAVTGTDGVAVWPAVVFPKARVYTYDAKFVNTTRDYANRDGAFTFETSEKNVTVAHALAGIVLTPTSAAAGLINSAFTFTATVSRAVAPLGVIANARVKFTLTDPSSVATYVKVRANALGVAAFSFEPSVRGVYTVSASFHGDGCHLSATSNTASITAYQPVTLAISAAPVACGAPGFVTATLSTFVGSGSGSGTPIAGQTITFSLFGGSNPQPALQTTDANGTATVQFTYPDASGSVPFTATFSGAYFTDATGAVAPPIAAVATTSIAIPSAATHAVVTSAPANVVVGVPFTVSVAFSRADNAAALVGSAVTFDVPTFQAPDETTSIATTTDGAGVATLTFTATARGLYSIKPAYAGSTCLQPAVVADVLFKAYQRTALVVSTLPGVCGTEETVTATLTTFGGATADPIGSQSIMFSFGGVIPGKTAQTTASGVATPVGVTFPAAGSFAVSATFYRPDYYYTNAAGALPPVQTAAVAVPIAVNSCVSNVRVQGVLSEALVGSQFTVTAEVTRATPEIGLAGVPLVFTLSNGALLTATTDGNGAASVTFTLSTPGAISVVVSYAGDNCVLPSASAPWPVSVYQPTRVTLAAASGVAGGVTTLSATLVSLPLNSLISGAHIAFDLKEMAASTSGITYSGVAVASATYSIAGTFDATAKLILPANSYYTDADGSLPPRPPTSTQSVVISLASTALTNFTVSPANTTCGTPITVSLKLRRTVDPKGLLPNENVRFTLLGPGGSNAFRDVNTGVNVTTGTIGVATATFSGAEVSAYGKYFVYANYSGSATHAASKTPVVAVMAVQQTKLTASAMSALCEGLVTLSATLKTDPQGVAIAGKSVRFQVANNPPCTAVTSTNGVAQCTTSFSPAGSKSVDIYFDAVPGFKASSVATTLTIGLTPTTITYTGRVAPVYGQTASHAVFARGQKALLEARLTKANPAGGSPIAVAGRDVILKLGSGTGNNLQQCTAQTNSDGRASCLTSTVIAASVPLGPLRPITVTFAGDTCYAPPTPATAQALIFAFASGGTFSIGDAGSSALGATRTFLSSSWFSLNPLSASTQRNNKFVGFGSDARTATGAQTSTPTCGGYVNAGEDDSDENLPISIPEFIGVARATTAVYNPQTGPGGNQGNTNDCASNPCRFGGQCNNNYGGGYYCNCPRGLRHGLLCELFGKGRHDDDDDWDWFDNRRAGNGWVKHGTCNPWDTTFNVNSIVILHVPAGAYCNSNRNVANDGVVGNIQSACSGSRPLAGSGRLLTTYCTP